MKKIEFWKKGLPYVGNKGQKAQKIIEALPQGKRLIDAFGGGGSISLHAAVSKKWERVIYNDKRTTVIYLLKALIENKPHIDLDLFTHITREQFFDWRNNQPDSIERTLVLLCWSFSNIEKTYVWGKSKEQRRLDLIQEYIVNGDHNLTINERHKKYLASENTECLSPITRLKQLELIQQTEILLPIIYSNLNYLDLQIGKNDVVYCDPPYLNADYRYDGFYDYQFYNWLNNLPTDNIFISERQLLPHTKLFKDLGTKSSFSKINKTDHELLLKYIKH